MSITAAITSTAPMVIPTMAPVGRLADSSLLAETVEEGPGGMSLFDLVTLKAVVDVIGEAAVDVIMVVEIMEDCSMIFTIAITKNISRNKLATWIT